ATLWSRSSGSYGVFRVFHIGSITFQATSATSAPLATSLRAIRKSATSARMYRFDIEEHSRIRRPGCSSPAPGLTYGRLGRLGAAAEKRPSRRGAQWVAVLRQPPTRVPQAFSVCPIGSPGRGTDRPSD